MEKIIPRITVKVHADPRREKAELLISSEAVKQVNEMNLQVRKKTGRCGFISLN